VDKSMEKERSVGKEAVLGCGYMMSAHRFGERCDAMGIDLAAAGTSAQEVVEGYRDAYPAIAGRLVTTGRFPYRTDGMWQNVEAAAKDAIGRGLTREAGRCVFAMDGAMLVVRLPSGRRLRYRNARVEDLPFKGGSSGGNGSLKPTIVFDGPKKLGEQ